MKINKSSYSKVSTLAFACLHTFVDLGPILLLLCLWFSLCIQNFKLVFACLHVSLYTICYSLVFACILCAVGEGLNQ